MLGYNAADYVTLMYLTTTVKHKQRRRVPRFEHRLCVRSNATRTAIPEQGLLWLWALGVACWTVMARNSARRFACHLRSVLYQEDTLG